MTDEETLLQLATATWPDQAAPWRDAAREVLVDLEATCYANHDEAHNIISMGWWLKLAGQCRWERARLKHADDAGPEIVSSIARLVAQASLL